MPQFCPMKELIQLLFYPPHFKKFITPPSFPFSFGFPRSLFPPSGAGRSQRGPFPALSQGFPLRSRRRRRRPQPPAPPRWGFHCPQTGSKLGRPLQPSSSSSGARRGMGGAPRGFLGGVSLPPPSPTGIRFIGRVWRCPNGRGWNGGVNWGGGLSPARWGPPPVCPGTLQSAAAARGGGGGG